MRCKNVPRRDRCYFVGRRALTLNGSVAAAAWQFLAARLESFGDKDMPKYRDMITAVRDATIHARQNVEDSGKSWRCFHCDEIFYSPCEARQHFGITIINSPLCQISDEQMREALTELQRYRADDTELHRQIQNLQSEHASALRRAEEDGYAKGIADFRKMLEEEKALAMRKAAQQNATR